MNLTFLTMTDKELFAMRFQQDSDGKLARKEIQRRKKIVSQYWLYVSLREN